MLHLIIWGTTDRVEPCDVFWTVLNITLRWRCKGESKQLTLIDAQKAPFRIFRKHNRSVETHICYIKRIFSVLRENFAISLQVFRLSASNIRYVSAQTDLDPLKIGGGGLRKLPPFTGFSVVNVDVTPYLRARQVFLRARATGQMYFYWEYYF